MAQYTFATTPQQEAALTAVVASAGVATNDAFLQAVFARLLASYAQDVLDDKKARLADTYARADAATRAKILTAAGVSP